MINVVKKIIRGDWVNEEELITLLRGWKFSDNSLTRRLYSNISHTFDVLSHPEYGYEISYSPWWVYDRKSKSARFNLSIEEVCCFLSDFGWDLLEEDVLHYDAILAEMEG